MSYIIEKKDRRHRFKNIHGNYSLPYQAKVKLFNHPEKKNFAAYNDTTEDIKKLIQLSLLEKTRIRACGSIWSLSEAPHTDGILVFNVNAQNKPAMKFKGFLNANYLQKEGDTNEFLFAQCGNTIKDLNTYCTLSDRSLATSGASNGQTIAGAISTGVNGSAIDVGCIQDTVVGLHIIKGEGPNDSVYLEPESAPIINQQFADKINATLIRDDDLFYAALVSLGAFGYIHGVMIQTEPLFELHNFIRKVDIKDAYQYTQNGNIQGTPMDIASMIPEDLYHLKFYLNQYNLHNNLRAEIIYKIPPGQKIFGKLLQYGKDFLFKVVKSLTTIADDLIPPFIDMRLPKAGEEEIGTLGEIFGDTTNLRAGQFSCALAVNAVDTERVTQIMIAHFKKKGVKKIPALFSYRFVKQSKATIAYTQFEKNCIIGIDGIENNPTKKYLKVITEILSATGIQHTWHWGKRHDMDAAFVKKMYGNRLEVWRAQRASFLSVEVGKAFSSTYLDRLGLTTRYV